MSAGSGRPPLTPHAVFPIAPAALFALPGARRADVG